MGLFGGKSSDSKARIEELKKKIQAEQAALSADASPQPPVVPPPQPAPVQQIAQPAPMQHSQRSTYQQPPPMPVQRTVHHVDPVEELFEEEPMDEVKTGIILDLGDGMSLNLPIKSRMRLDEFLHIADKIRELQKLQRY